MTQSNGCVPLRFAGERLMGSASAERAEAVNNADTVKPLFPPGDTLPLLLARDAIEVHFHAITSIRRTQIVGVEALGRGCALNGSLIAPLPLFDEARRLGLTCELDRACQKAAFRAFAPLHAADPNLLLFVNVHADCIPDALTPGAGLVALARDFHIEPRSVVVEILETAIDDTDRMREAIQAYKDHGFLVALDDVGAGHSSLNRILQVRPDILKADRSLIENIETDFYKQEIYKAVLQMGEKLGGWVITEGVEKQDEALVALGLGADLFQGFYFNKPRKYASATVQAAQKSVHDLQDVPRVRETALCFKQQTLQKMRDERDARTERRRFSLEVAQSLQARLDETRSSAEAGDAELLKNLLRDAIGPFPAIESASLLDENGTQITDTILHPYPQEARKTALYPLPARGTSHALKEYFYVLMETPSERYETLPYVPLPSGDMCITISVRAQWENKPIVVCLHLFVAHANTSPKSPTPLE